MMLLHSSVNRANVLFIVLVVDMVVVAEAVDTVVVAERRTVDFADPVGLGSQMLSVVALVL